MNIDKTIRVELDDDDIRAALEAYVRKELGRGGLKATKLRIYDTSAPQPVGGTQPAIDYGLLASLEFEPAEEPVQRGVMPGGIVFGLDAAKVKT